MEEPTEGQEITLLVKVEEVSTSTIEAIESTGSTVDEQIPLNYLVVDTTEEQLAALSSLEFVIRIEIESSGEVMGSGFHTRTGSTL